MSWELHDPQAATKKNYWPMVLTGVLLVLSIITVLA